MSQPDPETGNAGPPPMPPSLEEMVGFNQALGVHLTEWRDGHATMSLDLKPMLLNWSGTAHGGVLATLIDAACGFCGVWVPEGQPVKKAITLTMTTNFLAQCNSGRITVTAVRKGGGKRIFFASAELRDAEGTLLAMGEGSYRIRESDPFGTPKA